jgi:hypothetical protein
MDADSGEWASSSLYEEQLEENKKKLWDAIFELKEKNPDIVLGENGVPDEETLSILRKKYGIVDVFDPTEKQRSETVLTTSRHSIHNNNNHHHIITMNEKLSILFSK